MEKMSLKYDLLVYKNGEITKEGKCSFMALVFLEVIFELFMTQIGLLDIYTDIAFATIAK
jgi:hypothetical protein